MVRRLPIGKASLHLLESLHQRRHLAAQAVDHARHGVGNTAGRRAVGDELFGLVLVAGHNDPGRNAHRRNPRRHVPCDHGVGADTGSFADGDGPQNLGAGADDGAVLYRRVTLLVDLGTGIDGRRDAAQGDRVIQGHVVPDDRGFAHHDAGPVVDNEAAADLGGRMNLNSGKDFTDVRDEPPQQAPAAPPGAVGDAVKQQSVKARITKDHLQARPCRRVAGQEGVDILLKPLENHRLYYILGIIIRVPKGRVYACRRAGVGACPLLPLWYIR